MRQVGCLFLGLAFLAGLTVTGGSYVIGLLNVVVFLVLALAVDRFIVPRFGRQGMVYGMAGAFFISILWPYALIAARSGDDCIGDACLLEIDGQRNAGPNAQEPEGETS